MGNDTLDYNATITGWSVDGDDYPKLDSIRFDLRGYNVKDKEVITIEKITQQKRKKLHFGPSIGAGYGITNKKPDLYVGVSLTLDL